MKRNYYIAGFTWDGDSQLDRFKEEHIWENGYDEKYEDVYNTMRVGDHIALKSTYVKNSKSYLRIFCTGVIKKIHADKMRVEVDWKECRKDLTDITWYANTLCKIDNEEHIKRIFNMDNHEETKQDLAELLTTNHNLILTGAPGTGKTYLAKQIAQQLIFGEAKENLTADEQRQFDEQCSFVQFHPSYDYTDFVEGLRPVQDENGYVGFKRKNGVFKEFCRKALLERNVNTIEDAFKFLWEKIRKNEIERLIQYGTNQITQKMAVKVDNPDTIYFLRKDESFHSDTSVTLNKIKIAFNDKEIQSLDRLKSLGSPDRKMFGTQSNASNTWAVLNCLLSYLEKKPYVFIIDEINRGEISKIFGELFFSIDPGYRGIKGKVKTQYQNMVEAGDEFFDGFYVPKNVYIIGTMNDIDRSVESMDFAFRRRFAFKEIKADDNIEMLEELGELKDEAIERMKRLNTEISKIEGLSSAYHIGAAYFLKLKNYKDDADKGINSLWENHIKGLLVEYLRGMQDADEKLEKLEKAYNDDKDHSKKDKDNSEENKDNESTENIG